MLQFRPVGSKFEMVRLYYSAKRAHIIFCGSPTQLRFNEALSLSDTVAAVTLENVDLF